MPGPLSVRQTWEVGRAKEEMSARSFESLPRVLSYQFTRESLFFVVHQTLKFRGSSHLSFPRSWTRESLPHGHHLRVAGCL